MPILERRSAGRWRCRGLPAAPMPSISPGGERRSCFSTTWFRSPGGRSRSREHAIPGIAAIERRKRQIGPVLARDLRKHLGEGGARGDVEFGEPPPQKRPERPRQVFALAEVDDEK